MARNGALFTEAARLLGLGWSPEQITGRHKRECSVHRGLRVSHEAIYALPCGES
jgi:IS30 family transposase